MSCFENNIKIIKEKCQQALNDPWHNQPSILIPVKIINQLIQTINDCNQYTKPQENKIIEKETIEKCLNILQIFSEDVMSKPELKVGDGITKNLAIIEAIKIIKKEFQL